MALLVNSGPLSVTMASGRLRWPVMLIQEPADPLAGNRKVDHLADAFLTVVVHDVQNTETSSCRQLIRHEVYRPPLIQSVRHRNPVACRPAFPPLSTDREFLFSIDPIRPLRIPDQALRFQHLMQVL